MKRFLIFPVVLLFAQACGVYTFSGVNVPADVKTFSVQPFQNNSGLFVPGFADEFRLALIDKIQQMSDLEFRENQGDLQYSGTVTDYNVQPTASTADQTAALNRLTVRIKIDFVDQKHPENNFSKTYSYFFDFEADKLLSDIQATAHQEIIEQITQDIFNDTLAKW